MIDPNIKGIPPLDLAARLVQEDRIIMLPPNKKQKVFFESELLRLNCKKAKRLLNWNAILKFEELISMVADWYKNYYTM